MRPLPPRVLASLLEVARDNLQTCSEEGELGPEIEVAEELFARKLVVEVPCRWCSQIEETEVVHFHLTDLGRAALLVGSVG